MTENAKQEFPKIEKQILSYWDQHKIFEKHIKKTKKGKSFIFYEGPPTANGMPGIHHVLSRVYKDIFIRYYGLKGYFVPRKAGWDCHGLPVEREIEKELNIQTKSEIEEIYGLEKFNQLCRKSVLKYVDAWNDFSKRLGFWVDLKNPYYTMDNDYIESVWYLLKLIYKKGLLYKGYKVVPFDPIMGTTVSDAEVALGYKEVVDPSLTVKFKILDPNFTNTYFLVWTTTPWTLPANVALAVHPEEEYSWIEISNSEKYILASKLLLKNFKDMSETYNIIKTCKGKDLEKIQYERIIDFIEISEEEKNRAFYVVCGDFVTMDTGTGIVHIAPAYGADDLEIGLKYNLPVIYGVQLDGKFPTGPYKGKFFKEANKDIIKDLKFQNKIFKLEEYRHDYPFGWRSGAPLIYYAKDAWYIKTTAIKELLIQNNQSIQWIPHYIKQGRFGNWLENNKDWALSRERYWGTPLPIWVDEEGNIECIGSKKELEKKVKRNLDALDLHRPYIDEITWIDSKTKKEFRRVPEVIDCWFDSGAMPYAQWGWPHKNKSKFEKFFPADFISEAVDQTRGWFYTLLAISTIVSGTSSFKNVVCLGHVLDLKGEKMSKSKGNTVDPWEVFNTYGADSIRWYFLTGAPPGNSRRIGKPGQAGDPLLIVTGFFMMILNSLDFMKLYLQVDKINYKTIVEFSQTIEFSKLPEMDQWILSYLQQLIQEVTQYLDEYETMKPGKLIEEFVDSLSNWYIRRNRRRFWKGEIDEDKISAYHTLSECLLKISQLLSPFTPFLSEYVYLELKKALKIKKELPESIHLLDWPKPNFLKYNQKILEEGNILKTIAFLGRSARQKAKIKIRQPLKKIMIYAPEEKKAIIKKNKSILLEELNVKEIEFIDSASGIFHYQIRPNLPILGKKLGSKIKYIQDFLKHTNHDKIALELNINQKIQIPIENEILEFEKDDFLIDGISKEGTQGAEAKGFVVAIDTNVTSELYQEGLIRDLVRNIQETRKKAKLNINDRILLKIITDDEVLQQAILNFKNYIQTETLSQIIDTNHLQVFYQAQFKVGNCNVLIQIQK